MEKDDQLVAEAAGAFRQNGIGGDSPTYCGGNVLLGWVDGGFD